MKIVTFNSLGRYGRLANQMYQIAGTIGVARRNGFAFAFPPWKNWDHLERFASTEDIDLQKYFVNPLPVYNGPTLPDHPVEWGYHEVNLRDSVSLSGHFQSTKYFAHCFKEVAFYFRMRDEPPRNDYCAIHVRLGDYDDKYHPRMDMRYYDKAMAQFPGDQRFLVFSDEPDRARDMFRDREVDYARGLDYISDFRFMKVCRHFIIGNSSFSAMAALLGEAADKKVVAPTPWFGPAYAQITGKDIYDPDWTVINYEN